MAQGIYKISNTLNESFYKEGSFIKQWSCAREAENALNLSKGSVSRVLNGKYKNTRNYYFKYKPIE